MGLRQGHQSEQACLPHPTALPARQDMAHPVWGADAVLLLQSCSGFQLCWG